MKFSFLLFATLISLVGCSTARKNETTMLGLSPDLSTEITEIEAIQKLPSTNRDLDQGNDDVAQIPVEINSLVVKWMDWFQGRGRGHMERYLSRSSRYIPMMKQIIKERGLPEDLVYIALIESGFSSSAKSHAGAVGYWQFMRGTGKDYGLKINQYVDERRDPILSTVAAADYFSGLHNLFNSWYLAIASYNVGENRIKGLVMRHKTRDFWELISKGRLPQETVNYVPKFIAASIIAKNPKKYGFEDVDYSDPFAFDEITVEYTVSLKKVASLLEVDVEELRRLNPAFKTDYALPARGTSFGLRVPKGKKDLASTIVADARVRNQRIVAAAARNLDSSDKVRYRVKRGDSLLVIANRFRVTLGALARANRLSPRSMLRAGQTLVIPVASSGKAPAKASKVSALSSAKKVKAQIHVVKRGDTLASIARRYRVNMRQLAMANDLRSRRHILVGSRLQIP